MVKKDENGRVKIDLQTLISFLGLFVMALVGFYDLKTEVALIKKDMIYLKEQVDKHNHSDSTRMAARSFIVKHIN